jgi:Icc-related predicted phosphoesterase
MESRWRAEIVKERGQSKPPNAVRFLCFSDTHGTHELIPKSFLTGFDAILFAGDFSFAGHPNHISSFQEFINSLRVPAFVIAGNGDLSFDSARLKVLEPGIKKFCGQEGPFDFVKDEFVNALDNISYLEDEATVWNGIKIFGSPYSPEFCDLAFQIRAGEGRAKWAAIPDDVDIVLSHGPPKGICDMTANGLGVGDQDLREAIERTKPALCIFGHIHEAHGVGQLGETLCCNVALALAPSFKVGLDPFFVDLIRKD